MVRTDSVKVLATPPLAEKQLKILAIHGDERSDSYYWLRDRESSKVLEYIKAENEYAAAMMQHTEPLQEKLYNEMLARIQETDLSVPARKDKYFYYTRTEEGKAYAIHCRKQGSLEAPEEILIDQNQLAEGQEFFDLGDFVVSPNHRFLAYATDTSGAERYVLFFIDLKTKERFSEAIEDTYADIVWGNDNRTVFYTKVDRANRPYQLWRHLLGTDPKQDELVYEEKDDAYFLGVGKTRSEAYIFMYLNSKVTTEIRYLDADRPEGEFRIFQPQQKNVEYDVEHHGEDFYIVTNENAINFKLMKAPVSSPGKENWQEIIPHREDVMLVGASAFADRLVVYERRNGLPTVRVRKLSTGEDEAIEFPEPTYTVSEGKNPEFHTQTLRFNYASMVTPSSVFDYDMETQQRELRKEVAVLGGYDRTLYESDRIYATAEDGTKVPISIVYRKDLQKDGKNPLLLIGYGSYGISYPASFSSARLSLLERGVAVAIAHVSGGGEMGRKWYEDGKMLCKRNTFTDFIACAEHLIAEKWTGSDRLAISGGSAGGLLIGAVLNLRPDLFHAAIANVPFVDVVTTILDPDLPLTVIEWDEWGNPNDKAYYDYIKSYSPYDNVAARAYPHLLVTGGLNDSRVMYWEPAKWTAKLREVKTDDRWLLLKTNMGAGHSGASGRYESLKEIAFEYAFLFDRWGLT